jgi:hypothetical protein
MRAIGRAIQADFAHPSVDDPGRIASWIGEANCRFGSETRSPSFLDRRPRPRLDRIPAHFRDLELDGSPCLSLHHYCARVHVILVRDVTEAKANQVAGAEL